MNITDLNEQIDYADDYTYLTGLAALITHHCLHLLPAPPPRSIFNQLIGENHPGAHEVFQTWPTFAQLWEQT